MTGFHLLFEFESSEDSSLFPSVIKKKHTRNKLRVHNSPPPSCVVYFSQTNCHKQLVRAIHWDMDDDDDEEYVFCCCAKGCFVLCVLDLTVVECLFVSLFSLFFSDLNVQHNKVWSVEFLTFYFLKLQMRN